MVQLTASRRFSCLSPCLYKGQERMKTWLGHTGRARGPAHRLHHPAGQMRDRGRGKQISPFEVRIRCLQKRRAVCIVFLPVTRKQGRVVSHGVGLQKPQLLLIQFILKVLGHWSAKRAGLHSVISEMSQCRWDVQTWFRRCENRSRLLQNGPLFFFFFIFNFFLFFFFGGGGGGAR